MARASRVITTLARGSRKVSSRQSHGKATPWKALSTRKEQDFDQTSTSIPTLPNQCFTSTSTSASLVADEPCSLGTLPNFRGLAETNILDQISEGRRFVSIAGYGDALVPDETRVGDLICVILGARTPYVLRPRQKHYSVICGSPGEYTLVGECYVEGMMHGEVLRQSLGNENVIARVADLGGKGLEVRDVTIY